MINGTGINNNEEYYEALMPKDMRVHEFGEINQMAPFKYAARDRPDEQLRENKY